MISRLFFMLQAKDTNQALKMIRAPGQLPGGPERNGTSIPCVHQTATMIQDHCILKIMIYGSLSGRLKQALNPGIPGERQPCGKAVMQVKPGKRLSSFQKKANGTTIMSAGLCMLILIFMHSGLMVMGGSLHVQISISATVKGTSFCCQGVCRRTGRNRRNCKF